MKIFPYLVLLAIWFTNPVLALEKLGFEDQVKIEHAELILPEPDSEFAQAYLVIWNGTDTAVSVTSIKGQDGIAQIVNTKENSDGELETIPSSMPRYIPARSEFSMRKNGHYLMVPVRNLKKNNSDFLFSVELGSGRILIAAADVLKAGSEPLDHHHGSKDN